VTVTFRLFKVLFWALKILDHTSVIQPVILLHYVSSQFHDSNSVAVPTTAVFVTGFSEASLQTELQLLLGNRLHPLFWL
jgi:hypothetical protein